MLQYLYLLLCVLGVALPYSQFIPFLHEHGLNGRLLVEQLFANRISGFFGLDVIVSSVVLWAFVFTEGRRRQMKRLWAYVLCNLLVGVSFALPLFLYARERQVNKQRDAAAAATP
jgi:Protein of unknown function DUF2834